MKKLILNTLALTLTTGAFASDLRTRIIDIIPTEAGDEAMIYAEDEGRVIWVDSRDESLLNALESAKKNNHELRMDYEEESGQLLGVELLESLKLEAVAEVRAEAPKFSPTVLPSVETAQKIFNEQDTDTKRRAQCFNRAHGWAYDMWKTRQVNSQKMFLFFTRRFIERWKYKWWFHVAPFVMVQTDEGVKEMLMDVSFFRGPVEKQRWTDNFIPLTKPFCPEVTKYSDYRNNQYAEDCYVMKTTMYYRSPRDLELLENEGRQELNWNPAEVLEAKKQAFKTWKENSL